MTDRDTFAAAALTGLLVHANDGIDEETLDTPSDIAYTAYAIADAMLRERSRSGKNSSGGTDSAAKCTERDSATHDAAPAARARTDADRGRTDKADSRPGEGTGDTQEIAAYRRFVGEVMNWISEATGFLHDDVLRTDDARDFIHNACMRCWDAFDRIAYPTIHGASPEARASGESVVPQPTPRGDSDRTDKAAPRPSEGTGDTPDSPKPIKGGVSDRSKPINGPDPDSRVWETPVHTPATHATRGEGSEQRECTEPVAWGVVYPNDEVAVIAFKRKDAEERATASDRVVPLYRHPPCQDVSQKNLTLTDAEREAVEAAVRLLPDGPYTDYDGTVVPDRPAPLRGLLERLGGGR